MAVNAEQPNHKLRKDFKRLKTDSHIKYREYHLTQHVTLIREQINLLRLSNAQADRRN